MRKLANSKVFALLTILLFLFTVCFGSLYVIYESTNHDMDFHCPFMFGDQMDCGDDLVAHVSGWNVFLGGFTSLFVIALLLIQISVISKVHQLILSKFNIVFVVFQSLYSQIFSSGLLNPKAP